MKTNLQKIYLKRRSVRFEFTFLNDPETLLSLIFIGDSPSSQFSHLRLLLATELSPDETNTEEDLESLNWVRVSLGASEPNVRHTYESYLSTIGKGRSSKEPFRFDFSKLLPILQNDDLSLSEDLTRKFFASEAAHKIIFRDLPPKTPIKIELIRNERFSEIHSITLPCSVGISSEKGRVSSVIGEERTPRQSVRIHSLPSSVEKRPQTVKVQSSKVSPKDKQHNDNIIFENEKRSSSKSKLKLTDDWQKIKSDINNIASRTSEAEPIELVEEIEEFRPVKPQLIQLFDLEMSKPSMKIGREVLSLNPSLNLSLVPELPSESQVTIDQDNDQINFLSPKSAFPGQKSPQKPLQSIKQKLKAEDLEELEIASQKSFTLIQTISEEEQLCPTKSHTKGKVRSSNNVSESKSTYRLKEIEKMGEVHQVEITSENLQLQKFGKYLEDFENLVDQNHKEKEKDKGCYELKDIISQNKQNENKENIENRNSNQTLLKEAEFSKKVSKNIQGFVQHISKKKIPKDIFLKFRGSQESLPTESVDKQLNFFTFDQKESARVYFNDTLSNGNIRSQQNFILPLNEMKDNFGKTDQPVIKNSNVRKNFDENFSKNHINSLTFENFLQKKPSTFSRAPTQNCKNRPSQAFRSSIEKSSENRALSMANTKKTSSTSLRSQIRDVRNYGRDSLPNSFSQNTNPINKVFSELVSIQQKMKNTIQHFHNVLASGSENVTPFKLDSSRQMWNTSMKNQEDKFQKRFVFPNRKKFDGQRDIVTN